MDVIKFIQENQNYFEDFITRSTYHSNAIEGNTLSYAETYAILFNDNDFEIKAKPREIYEAINHKYALSYIMKSVETGDELSEQMIKKIAMQINKNIMEISDYRKVPVMIRGAEHLPPQPKDVPAAMMYWTYNFRKDDRSNIYEKAADYHIQFERIHPFEDGNGRTGRLLINYELLRNNLFPIVIPKEDRTTYFELISSQNISGLGELFLKFEENELERAEQFQAPEKETLNMDQYLLIGQDNDLEENMYIEKDIDLEP